MLYEPVIEALWIILPAYAANGLAILAKGRHPIDFGKNLSDGRRVFGGGKTFEGFFLGIFFALAVSFCQSFIQPAFSGGALNLVRMTPVVGLLLGSGAMLGDLAASFIKRRLGMERGRQALFLDQLDFLAGSLLLASLAISIHPSQVILLAALTFIIHRLTNFGAYKLRLKDRPY